MKHSGSCHCGAIKFEADCALDELLSCNCSICAKRGHLLSFVPESNFKLLAGENNLADYQWGKKTIHFHFCKNCGVAPFGQATMPNGKTYAVNARCLDDADLSKSKINEFDGKHKL